MTQPKVNYNTKSVEVTFKVNYMCSSGTLKQTDISIIVPKTHSSNPIESAENHVRTKLINFHSFA